MMFNFFKRSKKDHDINPSSRAAKEKRNKEKCTIPTQITSDMCKNKLTQRTDTDAHASDVSAECGAVTDPVKREQSATVFCSDYGVNDTNSSTADVSVPDEVAMEVNKSGVPPFLSYSSVVKKSDDPRENKVACVKPCGHGTVAIAPRIILTGTKKVPVKTPPSSPISEAKPQSRGVDFNFTPPENKAPDSNAQTQGDKDVVTGAIKLKLDFPKVSPSSDSSNASGRENVDYGDSEKKNLINQEAKFQSQLNDLSKQLSFRDAETNGLRFQMDELQRDVFAKSAGIDRLQAELQNAHKESDTLKQKIRHLEQELEDYKRKNAETSKEVEEQTDRYRNMDAETSSKISQLEAVICDLREQKQTLEIHIEALKCEKDQLERKYVAILAERDEEKKTATRTLETTAQEKLSAEKKLQEDFEKMRTVNITKEQQLLDDFEWKLREIEQRCKKRIQEKDKMYEEQLSEVSKEADVKTKEADKIMQQVEQLKCYEVEVKQLRGLTQEQQKSLKLVVEQQEQMKLAEKTLLGETKRLRTLIDMEKENLQHMQRLHNQELLDNERKLQVKLEQAKMKIAIYWEEKLLQECGRLKYELEQLNNEDKQQAINAINIAKEEEFEEAKTIWDKNLQDALKEISFLKKSLVIKDEYYHEEMMKTQTNTDRDLLELRRVMDKIDMMHHDKFEKLVEAHDLELEKINEDTEKRIKDLETNCQNQLSSMRTTLELVKEQMERESQQKIETLIAQHRSELDKQWENLIHQKSEAIKLVEEEYFMKYKTLEDQFYTQQKSHESREVELLKTIDTLKNDISGKESTIEDLQNNVDTLEGGIQVLHQEIAHQGEQLLKVKIDADHKVRGLQEAMVKLQSQQKREREDYEVGSAQIHKQYQVTTDQLQRKCQCLTKLFEEIRARYDRRESRKEDLSLISDLQHVIAEQEKDLACVNEEKRYYQLKLMELGRNSDEMKNSAMEFDDAVTQHIQKCDINTPNGFPPPYPALSANGPNAFTIPPTIPECEDE